MITNPGKPVDPAGVTGKPGVSSARAREDHEHDTTDLKAALDAKTDTGHTHVESDVTDLAHYDSTDFLADHSVAAHPYEPTGAIVTHQANSGAHHTKYHSGDLAVDHALIDHSHTHVETDITDLDHYTTTDHAAEDHSHTHPVSEIQQVEIATSTSTPYTLTNPTTYEAALTSAAATSPVGSTATVMVWSQMHALLNATAFDQVRSRIEVSFDGGSTWGSAGKYARGHVGNTAPGDRTVMLNCIHYASGSVTSGGVKVRVMAWGATTAPSFEEIAVMATVRW